MQPAAHGRGIRRSAGTRIIAQRRANERENLRYLYIGEHICKAGHGLAWRSVVGRGAVAAFYQQADQRRSVLAKHRRIASELGEGLRDSRSVDSMTLRAKRRIDRRAGWRWLIRRKFLD